MLQNFSKFVRKLLLKIFKSETATEAACPILFLCRWTTVFPYKVRMKSNNSKTVLSIPCFVYFLLFKIFYFTSYAMTVANNESNFDSKRQSPLLVFGEKLQIHIGFVIMVLLCIDTFLDKDDIAKIFKILCDVDTLFVSLGRRGYYTMLKFRLFSFIVLVLCIHNGVIMLDTRLSKTSWLSRHFGAIYTPTQQVTFTIFLYFAFVYTLSLHLIILNEEFTKLSRIRDPVSYDVRRVIVSTISRSSRNELLYKRIVVLWTAHAKICDCCALVNRYFSKMVLVIVALSFVGVVFNSFALLNFLSSLFTQNVEEFSFLIFSASRCFVHSFNMFVIIYACNLCEQLSKKTTYLINDMMVAETDKHISVKLQQLSIYLVHAQLRFTAAGLFTINNTLFFTIGGALTTYMIILVQFSI